MLNILLYYTIKFYKYLSIHIVSCSNIFISIYIVVDYIKFCFSPDKKSLKFRYLMLLNKQTNYIIVKNNGIKIDITLNQFVFRDSPFGTSFSIQIIFLLFLNSNTMHFVDMFFFCHGDN